MAFTLPDYAEATNTLQAMLMQTDLDALVAAGAQNGVLSGLGVTPQGSPNMTLTVAAGTFQYAGKAVSSPGGTVTISTADATNPRVDLVTISSTGALTVTAGTPVAYVAGTSNPVAPAIPSNHVLLATVVVPAGDTTIDLVNDRRVFVTGRRTVNVLDYGAAPDKEFSDGVWTSASTTLTSASAGFTSADAGKIIWLQHGISGGYNNFYTTIASVTNSTTIVLTAAPTATASANGIFGYNTEQNTAFQAALTAVHNAGGGEVFVPRGSYCGLQQIELLNRESLRGSGRRATMLRFASGINTDCIITRVGDDSPVVIQAANFCSIQDLGIDGNRFNQTGTSNGINLSGYPFFVSNAQNEDIDSHHFVVNVWIFNCLTHGLTGSGRSGNKIVNVDSFANGGNGFRPNSDTYMAQCHAGVNGLSGFRLQNSNLLLVNCQSFNSGQSGTSGSGGIIDGHGYSISSGQGGIALVGCSSQDNQGNGYFVYFSNRVTLTGCIADTNGMSSAGTMAGFHIESSAWCCIEGGIAWNRSTNVNNNQQNALRINGSGVSVNNRISLTHSSDTGGGAASPGAPVHASSSGLTGNSIQINGQGALQTVTYAATITPDPYAGDTIAITLTGNITINVPTNKHTGMRMTFIFTQSGANRVVTWGAGYKASWTQGTSNGAMNTISFVYDGTNWVQTAAAVSL